MGTSNQKTFTHKYQGGIYQLINDAVEVEGLDQTLVQYIDNKSQPPKLMLLTKWSAEYRQLLPLECYYCGGTGKDPAKSSMPCGYCFGSSLLDANGNAITKCDKTSDLLKELLTSLNKTIRHQQATIDNLRSLPGVTQLERQASSPRASDVYPHNANGPGGSKLCGD